MGHLSSMFRSLSIKRKNLTSICDGKEAVETMAKNAKRTDMILRTSGVVNVEGSNNLASVFSKRGEKGVNQDCCIVWEEFGCQEDMLFCGIFDGHGPWGHYVAKSVRESMPSSLLCNWQETLAETSSDSDSELESEKLLHRFNIWNRAYTKACAAVDQELEHHQKIDTFHSGTTALTVVRQGDSIFIANVGDSRAILGTTSDDGSLVAAQLTTDFKPNIPQEAERITQCQGRVYCLDDEPGVHRLWQPHKESPGLAMSRAFGDYCVKDFGLVSVPEVTHRHITENDQFIVLATDGVWDVVSNEEAAEIVQMAPDREKAAKQLVQFAARAWRRKRRSIAMDDISAIVVFLHHQNESDDDGHCSS
ncbi:probable protein phosphatase 2C 34 [Andrographis paniculata]|uniref:probable protein phosphatase 2C 34 n=1 Tax=Andrographis paniculata TaxID=175694 RepID=UPI0021E76827|nr:probable protein phosphatase 2C 34 [Andrographis paniculata]